LIRFIFIRSELEIHIIDFKGKIKWSCGGKDIWLNIEGKSELTILDNELKLIDFG
jgi:hypothetical protein